MDQSALDERIKANAYRVFFAEIEKHIAEARGAVEPGKTPGSEDLRRVGTAFHTIRGGAGFFGLDELAMAAGRIEHLLLQDTQRACAELEDVRQRITQICALINNLPKPK